MIAGHGQQLYFKTPPSREQPDDSLLFAIQADQIQHHNLKTLPASAIVGCDAGHSCRIDGFAENRAAVDDGRLATTAE